MRLGLAAVCATVCAFAAEPPDTALYGRVLASAVREDGRVDYRKLRGNADLEAFTRQIAAVSPDSHPALFPSREAKLAYWINAYNALVLRAFAAEYPEKRTRLKGLLGKANFFYRQKHVAGGVSRTLDNIEDKSIRSFGDPRIHFAIVCASASCPALSRTPYTAANLNEQLERETREYFAESRNFRMDETRREVTLPRILDWFKDDFGDAPAKVLEFVARYRQAEAQRLRTGPWKLRYFDYDWSPNDLR